jgi:hypothetical protein
MYGFVLFSYIVLNVIGILKKILRLKTTGNREFFSSPV